MYSQFLVQQKYCDKLVYLYIKVSDPWNEPSGSNLQYIYCFFLSVALQLKLNKISSISLTYIFELFSSEQFPENQINLKAFQLFNFFYINGICGCNQRLIYVLSNAPKRINANQQRLAFLFTNISHLTTARICSQKS